MKNVFRQHIPRFVDDRGITRTVVEFSSMEELFAIPDVIRCKSHKTFHGFAMSDEHLLALYDDGFNWSVVGSIKYPSVVYLPKWDGGKYRAELPDGTQTVLSKEVQSTCGDVLELLDGTRARNIKSFTRV